MGSVLRAERIGFLKVLQHGRGPLQVAVDNNTVYRGFQRGEVWCTKARRPHADLRRRIWLHVRDEFQEAGALEVVKVKAHSGRDPDTLVGQARLDVL
eukprot:5916656-Pyramimonas_sp.AAC.1